MHPCEKEGTFMTVSSAPHGASFPDTLLVPHKPDCTAAAELFIRKQPREGGGRNFCFQRIKSARRRGERSLPTIARKYLEHKSRQKTGASFHCLSEPCTCETQRSGGRDTLRAAFSKGRFLQETVPPSIFPLLFREKFAKRHR